jgi:uncharacterized repeat protein (TIGR01451 family)
MSGVQARSLRFKAAAVGITLGALAMLSVTLLTAGAGAGVDNLLSVEKADSPDPVQTDDVLTYTITIENLTTNPVTGVSAEDKLPNSVKFASANASQGTCDRQGRTVTCDLGTLGAEAVATVEIRVRPKRAGTISNTASVSSDPADPNAADNEATEQTKVTQGPSCGGKAATIVGTPGSDVITGTDRRDVITALGGDDQVNSLGGKDSICGKSGNDTLKGKADDDLVKGGGGRDTGKGGSGDDVIRGGAKRDRLRGGSGDDLLAGGGGNDSCRGGPGVDTLSSC